MYPELAQRWQARTLKVIAIFLVFLSWDTSYGMWSLR